MPPAWLFDDVGQVHRTDQQQHGDDDEADRDFVAHHLRRRAQAAEERILRVRRPAAHDDAVDAERGDREQVEHADIEVGDHPARRDRDHRPADEGQRERQERRQQEHRLVGAGRDDDFLEHELEEVREGLQQAERADDVGALAQLHRRPDLAVEQQQEGERHQQDHDEGEDLRTARPMPPHMPPPHSKSCSHVALLLRRHRAAARRQRSAAHSAMVAVARAIGLVR